MNEEHLALRKLLPVLIWWQTGHHSLAQSINICSSSRYTFVRNLLVAAWVLPAPYTNQYTTENVMSWGCYFLVGHWYCPVFGAPY